MIGRTDDEPLGGQIDRLSGYVAHGTTAPGRTGLVRLWTGGPQMALLLTGIAAGPAGLGMLSSGVLGLLDPVLPVALGALGVLAVLSLTAAPGTERRVAVAAAVDASVTAALVAAAVFATAPSLSAPLERTWLLALAAGVCASVSSPRPSARSDDVTALGDRLADRDVLAGILLMTAVMAVMPDASPAARGWLLLHGAGVAALIAVVGWLLLTHSTSDAEQRVFGAATLLLLGGMADYLGMPPLLAGAVAGAFWRSLGGPVRDCIGRDLAHIQHPLVALVLLMAGARVEFSSAVLTLALVYALVRAVAKLLGTRILSRPLAGRPLPALSRVMLAPGMMGIALALNAARGLGAEVTAVVSITVLGTLLTDLAARGVRAEDIE